jgi:uncharacterized protein YndB with AHSA1/START domain
MTASAGPETAVEVRRTFSATPDKVFQAWIDPSRMLKWFARGTEKNTITAMEADPRPGGKYRVVVRDVNGNTFHIAGTYREVSPPTKLVFTWNLEDQADFGETLVTIDFHRLGQSGFTELVLKHELLAEKYRPDHQKGWIGCFDLLEKVLANQI